jgi:hypothetical protein
LNNKESKICLVVPYFGTFKNYFQLWLDSVGVNSTIDFLLVTDQKLSEYQLPNNIHVKEMTFQEMQNRIHQKLGSWCQITYPYKLCDYKPAYGVLFEEELDGYDWFGFCDTDMIFGDIRHFLSEERLAATDKIGEGGMFVLLRNSEDGKHYFEKEYPTWGVNHKEAYSTSNVTQFDETDYMNRVFDLTHEKPHDLLYDEIGDTRPKTFDFRSVKAIFLEKELYRYQDGKLYRMGERGYVKEVMWVHFLAREMLITRELDPKNYWMVPNGFVTSYQEDFFEAYQPTREEIERYQERYRQIVSNKWIKRIKNGWFQRRIRYTFRKTRSNLLTNRSSAYNGTAQHSTAQHSTAQHSTRKNRDYCSFYRWENFRTQTVL